MPTVLLTGFPGFLGSKTTEHLLDRTDSDLSVTCLVEPRFMSAAETAAARLLSQRKDKTGRLNLIRGDITQPDLGLGNRTADLTRNVREIYHFAAVYHIGMSRETGMRVNVDGTRHVLDFAGLCPGLDRLHYVSTCYVSGRYDGTFYETDLEKGQRFNNYYEETKYMAEVEVRRRMQDGLPVTIYRPSVVAGDSRTGFTTKFDGIYYMIRWFLKFTRRVPMPIFDDPARYTFNVVPSDYATSAITYLSSLPSSIGKVYQIADPQPLTIEAIFKLLEEITNRKVIRLPVPGWIGPHRLPALKILTGLEQKSFAYLTHPTTYDTTNTTRDLAPSGIKCPPLPEYLHRLVEFAEKHG